MTKSFLLIALAMLFSQSIDAQIKRKYKDKKHKEQIVVIKDGKEVSDMDILKSQFDHDDIEIGQVIRITTENIPKDSLSQSPITEVPVQQAEQKTVLVIVTKEKAKVKKNKTAYKPGKAKTQKLGKFKNKKYSFSKRKKKKKRVGSNKKSCYNF